MLLERMGRVLIAEGNFVIKSILRFCGLWPCVVWYVYTNVSEVHTAEIFWVEVHQVMNVGGYTDAEDRSRQSYSGSQMSQWGL